MHFVSFHSLNVNLEGPESVSCFHRFSYDCFFLFQWFFISSILPDKNKRINVLVEDLIMNKWRNLFYYKEYIC